MTPRTGREARAARARKRLSDLLDARAEELGLTWKTIAARVGRSDALLRKIKTQGQNIVPEVEQGLEKALWWQEGSIKVILAGGDPLPAPLEKVVDNPSVAEIDIFRRWRDELPEQVYWRCVEDLIKLRREAFEQGRLDAQRNPDHHLT